MTAEIEVTQPVIKNFSDYLRELQTKIQQSHSQESRRCNQILGWTAPPVGKKDLALMLAQLIDYIESHKFQEVDELSEQLDKFKELFTEWSKTPLNNLYQSNYSHVVVANFVFILNSAWDALKSYDEGLLTKEFQSKVKQAKRRIDALVARLNKSEESIGGVEDAMARIVDADKAAIQLPETLSSLEEDKANISKIKEEIQNAKTVIMDVKSIAEDQRAFIVETKKDIEDLLSRSKSVLATATSTGLASAFYRRKEELQEIGRNWTKGLVAALVVAIFAIIWRADKLFDLLDRANEIGAFMLMANFVISIGFIGAPIWFAWLATKQIGYYFRLSEDYAFKASVSASYEGFMEEARRHDSEFEKKVLESTLERYDEPPLRFVDSRVHGSPYHELFESDEFKSAMKTIPGFKDRVMSALKGCFKTPDKSGIEVEGKPPVDSK